jgi:hypothetical protein
VSILWHKKSIFLRSSQLLTNENLTSDIVYLLSYYLYTDIYIFKNKGPSLKTCFHHLRAQSLH